MKPRSIKALKALALETRNETRCLVENIHQIARKAWKEQSGQELPAHVRLLIEYDGEHGEGQVVKIEARVGEDRPADAYSEDGPRRAVSHALLKSVECQRCLIRLVNALTALSGHGEWAKDWGSVGWFTVNLDDESISRYSHTKRTMKFETDYIDVDQILAVD